MNSIISTIIIIIIIIIIIYRIYACNGTNRVSMVCNVAAIPLLQSMAHVTRKAEDTILQHTTVYYSHHKELQVSAVQGRNQHAVCLRNTFL